MAPRAKSDAQLAAESLKVEIARIQGDIDFIDQKLGVEKTPMSPKATGRGRPAVKALKAERDRLTDESHRKHTEWLRDRVARGKLDLKEGEFIVEHMGPGKRARGRPRATGKGAQLVAWTDAVQKLFKAKGKSVDRRKAILIARRIPIELLKIEKRRLIDECNLINRFVTDETQARSSARLKFIQQSLEQINKKIIRFEVWSNPHESRYYEAKRRRRPSD